MLTLQLLLGLYFFAWPHLADDAPLPICDIPCQSCHVAYTVFSTHWDLAKKYSSIFRRYPLQRSQCHLEKFISLRTYTLAPCSKKQGNWSWTVIYGFVTKCIYYHNIKNTLSAFIYSLLILWTYTHKLEKRVLIIGVLN